MNNQLKRALLAGMIVLLLAACGPAGTATEPAGVPDLPVTENPTSTAEPVVDSDPIEATPTVSVTEEPAAENLTQYIGMNYSRLPADLSQGFSMLIEGSEGYSMSLVSTGATKMLWLSKVAKYETNGNPIWEVKDVLGLSNLEAGLTLIPDGCSLNGVRDREIFAAGKNGAIVLAWRANTSLGTFEVVPANGIQCNSDKGMEI